MPDSDPIQIIFQEERVSQLASARIKCHYIVINRMTLEGPTRYTKRPFHEKFVIYAASIIRWVNVNLESRTN